MRKALTADQVERLGPRDKRNREAHRRFAERVVGWAESPHPDDELPPGELLVVAAEHRGFAGDAEGALALYRRAVESGDDVFPGNRCYLVMGLLRAGRHDEAHALADEIGRERRADPLICLFFGETYEDAGDAARAVTWFTRGVLRAVDDEQGLRDDVRALLIGRWRVRRGMGYPEDDLDAAAAALIWDGADDEPVLMAGARA